MRPKAVSRMVDYPREFPEPVIIQGTTGLLRVRSGTSSQQCPGIISGKPCTIQYRYLTPFIYHPNIFITRIKCPYNLSCVSESGMVYEIGQVIKNAIYGEIMVGLILQPG